MHRLPIILTLSASLALAGCAEQYNPLNQRFTESKAGARSANASGLALAAVAVQTALYHLTAAFSEEVAIDNKEPDALEGLSTDAQVTYSLDVEKGTGTVQAVRDGKKIVDLTLSFEQRGVDGGQLYRVKTLTGTVEGYQILLPKLLFTYTLAYDQNGNVVQRDGKDAVQVVVEAEGMLGLANEPVVKIARADLLVQYPFSDGEIEVGKIQLEREGLKFDGAITMANKAIAAKGAVVDLVGTRLYDIAANKEGLKLTAVQPPVPVEVQASGEAKVN